MSTFSGVCQLSRVCDRVPQAHGQHQQSRPAGLRKLQARVSQMALQNHKGA